MRLILFALLLTPLGSTFASAQKVMVEFDESANFTRFHTFTLTHGQLNSRNPALNSELVRKKIDDSIAHYLAAKGLTEVLNSGDVDVRYRFGSARKKQVEHYPAGWRGMGTRTVRVPYTEGTLVIDLNDSSLHSLVWRAIAYEDKSHPDQIAGKLDEMVKKAIAKYPPKTKK